MSYYTSEQILNQALDSATGTLKTSGPSGAASATAANQTTTNDRLGTPGTGEPAHAGGSTGLIGWARDILAKIAAFGTSSAPSADVLSVQPPVAQTANEVTLGALNDVLTISCVGRSEVNFVITTSTSPSLVVTIELEYAHSPGVFFPQKSINRNVLQTLFASAFSNPSISNIYTTPCAGAINCRMRISTYTSGSLSVAAVSSVLSSLPQVTEVVNSASSPLRVQQNTALYYTDTAAPLGAGATFTGSSRAMEAGNNAFNAYFRSDTSGAAFQIEVSTDNTNWRLGLPSVASTANSPSNQSMKRTTSFYRVVCAAGAAAQSVLNIHSSQTPN